MDCTVCCETLNKSNRKEVKCNYCEYRCCRSCFQKYLSETPDDPHCMNCKKKYVDEFIIENCTNVFITGSYAKHRENVLMDRERALLPATQPYVIIEKEKKILRKTIENLENEKLYLMRALRENRNTINDLTNHLYRMGANSTTVEETDRKKFVRKCSMEGCRGFLSTHWKCGICDKNICNKCNEEKTTNHECISENVASMDLLNKDTKPCPDCGTMIFKISGCDLMWCVDCHCSFSWNSGKINKGVNHNPHYYEFMRKGGNLNREHGDIPCGGLPDLYSFTRSITSISALLLTIDIENLYTIHNIVTHMQHHEIRVIPEINHNTNKELRINYLLGEISDEQFKHTLRENEKRRSKKRDFNGIYQMFVDVSSDIFRQLMITIKTEKNPILLKSEIETYLITFRNLREYFNDSLKKIGKRYKCVYTGLTDRFVFVNNYQTYLARINSV